jgi:hypothetical protein
MNKCPQCGHEWPDEKRARGGRTTASRLSPEQRRENARRAAQARWKDRPRKS